MSDAPGTAWQSPELAAEYMDKRRRVLPLLDLQEDVIRRVFERHGRRIERFLDVGSGAGAMSELMLTLAPGAEAVLVDYSEPMLAGAQEQLAGVEGSWRIARGDLREPDWHRGLEPGSFDAAVSGLAIHHLASERKRDLYAEVFELLAPGALFVNMDVVVVDGPLDGVFDEEMAALAIAHEHEHAHDTVRSDEEIESELLADDSDDQPDRIEEQLGWLRDAGFADVEIHFKWAEAVVFGARRP
jgi:SAM-dependent methyltransferase